MLTLFGLPEVFFPSGLEQACWLRSLPRVCCCFYFWFACCCCFVVVVVVVLCLFVVFWGAVFCFLFWVFLFCFWFCCCCCLLLLLLLFLFCLFKLFGYSVGSVCNGSRLVGREAVGQGNCDRCDQSSQLQFPRRMATTELYLSDGDLFLLHC